MIKTLSLKRRYLFSMLALLAGFAAASLVFQATAATNLPPNFEEVVFASGFGSPTAMEFSPDGRLFVAEKAGKLRVIDQYGTLLTAPFLTVAVDTTGERGLLGVAFDPNFLTNGHVYVYYTTPSPDIKNRVSRFTASGNPNEAIPNSESIVLDDIPSEHRNHNGGAIHFGNDGMLYIAVGDDFDSANGQSMDTLAGKLLRVNPDGSIPIDNPFFGDAEGALMAIWALGLRNPFTFAVDPMNGTIHINDVGKSKREEINLGSSGANYGWDICEGKCKPPNPQLEDPIFAYKHKGSAAITGGAFNRGKQFPIGWDGHYFFADYLEGFIKRLTPAPDYQAFEFATNASSPVDLKFGPDGSLYYLSLFESVVYKINHAANGDGITLTTTGYKVKGLHKADLEWSGATSVNVDVFRDGVPIATNLNDSFYTDNIDNKGNASYTHQVCEVGNNNICSNETTITP